MATEEQVSCRGGKREISNMEKKAEEGTVTEEKPRLRQRELELELEKVWRGCQLPHSQGQEREPQS